MQITQMFLFNLDEHKPLLSNRYTDNYLAWRLNVENYKLTRKCHQELDNFWVTLGTRFIHWFLLYIWITLIFSFYMYVLFYFTIKQEFPNLTGPSNVLNLNPGLNMVPAPAFTSTLIHVRSSDPKSFSALVDQMTAFLSYYQFHIIGGMFSDCEKTGYSINTRRPCRFDLDVAGPCNLKNGYGYPKAQPCFALKLNRIYGWLPDPVVNASGIQVKCEGLTESDSEFLGDVCYYDTETYRHHKGNSLLSTGTNDWCQSSHGLFHKMFYPFLNQAKYQAPLVFVQFRNPTRHVVIFVKCYAIARNIRVDVGLKEGSVVFPLVVD